MTFFVPGCVRLLCLWMFGLAILCGLDGVFVFAAEQSFDEQAQQLAQLPAEQLIEKLAAAQGEARTPLQLALLKRLDASIEVRERACDELIERYKDQDQPALLGAAYGGKAKVFGDRLDFAGALKLLDKSAEYGRQCSATDPGIYFKALCNRAVYLLALGKRDEPVQILREAIEFAKPFGDRLDVPFAYAMLGRLAEASGAVDRAFDYLQMAFESSSQSNNATQAAQAGISILELAIAEHKFDLAKEWMERIEPWVQKSNDPRTKFALGLRRHDLTRALGDPQAAALGVQKIIDQLPEDAERQNRGLLYLSLAASRFEAREYDAALQATDQAAELLKPILRSWTLTQVTRIECLFALGKSEEGLKAADELLEDQRIVALHRIQLLELKSRILASLQRPDESLAALQQCRSEELKRDTARAHEVAQFIKAAYDAQQREAELAASKAREQTAHAEAQLSQEVALRERTSAANDRFVKNAAILFSLLALVAGGVILRTLANRKTALAIAARERELNEQLQQRLNQQASQLEAETTARQQLALAVERKFRDEAIGKLTSGVAHDFNNLLTVIIHSSDLLRSQQSTKPETQHLLDAISSAAESGSSIVSQLMAYTRQQPLEPTPIEISNWLANTRTMLRQTLGKPIEFRDKDLSGGARICIDTAQLTNAIINLLANARDAIRPNAGTVELKIERIEIDDKSAEPLANLSPGHYIQFQVIDSGKGMTADELQHACEPFFTTKSVGAGTGLGLSTVLGFVKQSGGELTITSTPGTGTTVSFLLPITNQTVPSTNPAASLATHGESSQLLLVEDQDAVRTVLAAGLKSIGYEVTLARHAEEAMDIISQTGAPRIVLSDVRMPGQMNGVQLRRWVLDRYPHVRVVLMSGYRELDGEAENDSNIVFLQKPVKLQELHRALSM